MDNTNRRLEVLKDDTNKRLDELQEEQDSTKAGQESMKAQLANIEA